MFDYIRYKKYLTSNKLIKAIRKFLSKIFVLKILYYFLFLHKRLKKPIGKVPPVPNKLKLELSAFCNLRCVMCSNQTMKRKKVPDVHKKLAGGLNFVVVLWSLLTLLELTASFNKVAFSDFLLFDLFTLVIPILFLLVLNLFIGISIFSPKKKEAIWVLSIVVATAALISMNALTAKITELKGLKAASEEIMKF